MALPTRDEIRLQLDGIKELFALATGLAAVLDLDVGAAARHAISIHLRWAVFTTLVLLLLAIWRSAGTAQGSRPSWLFVILLVAASAALIVTGYRGGQNVYEFGIGVKRIAKLEYDKAPGAENTGNAHQDSSAACGM